MTRSEAAALVAAQSGDGELAKRVALQEENRALRKLFMETLADMARMAPFNESHRRGRECIDRAALMSMVQRKRDQYDVLMREEM